MTGFPVEKRAGGIVFRKTPAGIEYLLVTSNSNRERWIIPAGHVEEGETPEEAALREVTEEAGVVAKTVCDLGSYQYFWYRNHQKVILDTHLFIMEYSDTLFSNPEGRQVIFYPYEAMATLKLWDESRKFIRKAHRICTALSGPPKA